MRPVLLKVVVAAFVGADAAAINTVEGDLTSTTWCSR